MGLLTMTKRDSPNAALQTMEPHRADVWRVSEVARRHSALDAIAASRHELPHMSDHTLALHREAPPPKVCATLPTSYPFVPPLAAIIYAQLGLPTCRMSFSPPRARTLCSGLNVWLRHRACCGLSWERTHTTQLGTRRLVGILAFLLRLFFGVMCRTEVRPRDARTALPQDEAARCKRAKGPLPCGILR